MQDIKRPASWRATYEVAVDHIRTHRPMTAWQVADELGWPLRRSKDAVARARELGLLAISGKIRKVSEAGRYRLIYGAVQAVDWPVQP